MSQMLCCNECGREVRDVFPFPGFITEDGEVEVYDDWRTAGFFDDEDNVSAVSRSVRWCMNCKKEVYSYVSHVNWDFWWQVVQSLRKLEYLTERQYAKLVKKELKANGYEDGVPLVEGADCKHENISEQDIFKYLQEKKLIGPKEKHLFFFERHKVLIPTDLKQKDLVPYAKVSLNGSCEECGKHNLAEVGGSCPICEKGILEHVGSCEPTESRGKKEFVLAGESLDKELYSDLFSHYIQGQLSLERDVRKTARDLFDGDIRKAVAEHEDFFADAFRRFREGFTIKGEVYSKDTYPCLFIAYCDFKIETVALVVDIAEKQFGGDIKLAVEAEDRRLRDQGLCSSRISRVTSKRCGIC
ncbi:hypothetical protein H6778_03630 [Candidatus Nomurabacteria bacterium]|nr:hypothetical protein [Candidatus Nomurabacteria bacterium]